MKWLLALVGAVLILAGSYLAAAIQTTGGVRVEDIRFAGTGGTRMSALLTFRPRRRGRRRACWRCTPDQHREMQDGLRSS